MRLVGLRRGGVGVVHRVGPADGAVRVVASVTRAGDRSVGSGSVSGSWSAGREGATTLELHVAADGELLEVTGTVRTAVQRGEGLVVATRTAGRPVFDRTGWSDERRRVEPLAVDAVRTPFDELELRVGSDRGHAVRSCWIAGNLQVLVAGDGRVRGVRVGPLSASAWADVDRR